MLPDPGVGVTAQTGRLNIGELRRAHLELMQGGDPRPRCGSFSPRTRTEHSSVFSPARTERREGPGANSSFGVGREPNKVCLAGPSRRQGQRPGSLFPDRRLGIPPAAPTGPPPRAGGNARSSCRARSRAGSPPPPLLWASDSVAEWGIPLRRTLPSTPKPGFLPHARRKVAGLDPTSSWKAATEGSVVALHAADEALVPTSPRVAAMPDLAEVWRAVLPRQPAGDRARSLSEFAACFFQGVRLRVRQCWPVLLYQLSVGSFVEVLGERPDLESLEVLNQIRQRETFLHRLGSVSISLLERQRRAIRISNFQRPLSLMKSNRPLDVQEMSTLGPVGLEHEPAISTLGLTDVAFGWCSVLPSHGRR